MAAEANELMGFAFRPGKDYKPLQLMEQARRQKALSAQAQAEEQQKKVNESLKFVKQLAFNPDHINLEANKYLTKRGEELNSLTAETLRRNNYILSPEEQLKLQEKQQQVLGEQRLLQASNDELVAVSNGFINNPDFRSLFNQEQAAVNLNQAYKGLFTEEGTINPEWTPDILRQSVLTPESLNQSKVIERFANTVETQLNEMILKRGNGDIKEISTKTNFAKLNSSGTDWERDASGNIKLNITPELVKSMRADEFTSVLLDDQLAKLQVENPAATYTEAAEKLLQQSVKTERKEALRTPSAGGRGSGRAPRTVTWNPAGQTTYKNYEEVDQGRRMGTEAVTIEANELKKGITFVLDDKDEGQRNIKGDVNRFIIDANGNPQIVVTSQVVSGAPPKTEYVPFNEQNYKSLRSSLSNKEDVAFLDEVYKSIPEVKKNQVTHYLDLRKTRDFEAEVFQALQNGNSSDEITQIVKSAYDKFGVEYATIEGYSPLLFGKNSVKIDGVEYSRDEIPRIIRETVNKKPSAFSTTIKPDGSQEPGMITESIVERTTQNKKSEPAPSKLSLNKLKQDYDFGDMTDAEIKEFYKGKNIIVE